MESFSVFRKHLAMSGIIAQPSLLNLYLPSLKFNLKNLAVILFASFYGSSLTKFLNEANTFDEYTDLIYKLSSVIVFTLSYIIIIWETSELLGFVNDLEVAIAKSKY